MTVPTKFSHAAKARPPLCHGARPLRQLSLSRPHPGFHGALPLGQPLSMHFGSHLRSPDPAPLPLLFPTQQDPYPRRLPPTATPGSSLIYLQPLFLEHAISGSPPPGLHPSPRHFSRTGPPPISTQGFPAPTTSPRTALQQFPPKGLTLFSLNHFFSNTIATNRLPLPDGPFVATETRRQQLWLGCA